MEPNLNVDEFISFFKDNLNRISCPSVENSNDSWIHSLIFEPSEHRLELLNWLFIRLDSDLDQILHLSSTNELTSTSAVQRLLNVASNLGFCSADDIEIIRGTSKSKKKTIAFFTHLIKLVSIVVDCEEAQENNELGLAEEYDLSCRFIDQVVKNIPISQHYVKNPKIFPPDIIKLLKDSSQNSKTERENHEPIFDSKQLAEQINSLEKDLLEKQAILNKFMEEDLTDDLGSRNSDTLYSTMQLLFTDLNQLVKTFCYSFENDLQQWCHHSSPDLNQIGPTIKRIDSLSQNYLEFLSMLSNLQKNNQYFQAPYIFEVFQKFLKEILLLNQCQQYDVSKGISVFEEASKNHFSHSKHANHLEIPSFLLSNKIFN